MRLLKSNQSIISLLYDVFPTDGNTLMNVVSTSLVVTNITQLVVGQGNLYLSRDDRINSVKTFKLFLFLMCVHIILAESVCEASQRLQQLFLRGHASGNADEKKS